MAADVAPDGAWNARGWMNYKDAAPLALNAVSDGADLESDRIRRAPTARDPDEFAGNLARQ